MDAVTNFRQQRGLELAKSSRIKHIASGRWLVPSQSSSGGYLVDVEANTCTCPDFETRAGTCKHQWAVIFQRRGTGPDGSPLGSTMRPTYQQNWSAYNAAQCEEKDRVALLLRPLCDGVHNPIQVGRGRRRLPLSDVIFGAVMKSFTGLSGRRATSDIRACEQKGLIDKAPSYNAIFEYFERPDLTDILKTLVRISAIPLANIETKFAIDGTGFGSKVYKRWFDAKYGREMKESTWVKLHAICGTTTNIITSVEVTEASVHDSPLLPQLVKETAEHFTIQEVLADKGYVSRANIRAIDEVSAQPYIAFKTNNKASGPATWTKAYHMFAFHRDEWLRHYHQRSNVESSFSALKRKFGHSVRARQHISMVNEVLARVIAYNLSCLVHAIHELGIEPTFWPSTSSEVRT